MPPAKGKLHSTNHVKIGWRVYKKLERNAIAVLVMLQTGIPHIEIPTLQVTTRVCYSLGASTGPSSALFFLTLLNHEGSSSQVSFLSIRILVSNISRAFSEGTICECLEVCPTKTSQAKKGVRNEQTYQFNVLNLHRKLCLIWVLEVLISIWTRY